MTKAKLRQIIKYGVSAFFVLTVVFIFQNCAKDLKINQYTDQSSIAGLADPPADVDAKPPVITFQTENQTLTEGQPLELVVTATGDSLQYEWLKNSEVIALANNDRFSILSTTTTDTGTYMVRVSNPHGEVTAEISVVVNPLQAQTVTCSPSELEPIHAVAGIKTLLDNSSYGACVPTNCITDYTLYGSTCYKNTNSSSITNGTKVDTFSSATGAYTTEYQCNPGTKLSANTSKDGASECLTVCYGWAVGAPAGSEVPAHSQYVQGYKHAELLYSHVQGGPVICRVYFDQLSNCTGGPSATALYNQCKDPNGCLMKATQAGTYTKYAADNTPLYVGVNNYCGFSLL